MERLTPVSGSLCQECRAPATQYLELGRIANGGKAVLIATFCSDLCEYSYWRRCKRIRTELPREEEEEEATEYELVDTSIIKIQPGINLDCHQFSREEIGRAGWTILHSFAAQYPEEPTEEEMRSMLLFIEHFARNYACLVCRQHFLEMLRKFPPDVRSRAALKLFMCTSHNRVNTSLGKAQYKCECAQKLLTAYQCRET